MDNPPPKGDRSDRGDRERYRKNLDRWKKMSPGDREAMRQLHDRRREEMRQDIKQALERSGLTLDDERKEAFIKRYRDERRQLEEQIRKEMDVIRGARLNAIIEKLRAEFAGDEGAGESQASPPPEPAGEASLSPAP